jgi:hypothetical protein
MPWMAGRRRPLPFLNRNRYPWGRLAGCYLKTLRLYGRGNLSPAQRLPPRLDAHPAVPSLADPHFAPRGHHVPALRFQLEKAIIVPHHPIATDGPFTLQSKDPLQFPRCLTVIILRPRCAPPEPLVVFRQILPLQIHVGCFVTVNPPPSQLLQVLEFSSYGLAGSSGDPCIFVGRIRRYA